MVAIESLGVPVPGETMISGDNGGFTAGRYGGFGPLRCYSTRGGGMAWALIQRLAYFTAVR